MAATFHLCASHHAGTRAGRELLTEICASFARPFRACHIGVFHGDERKWTRGTLDFLASLGAEVSAPRLSDRRIDAAAARRAIERADLLYLDGGDTVAGVDRIRSLRLESAFRQAAKSARAIFGLSGGACAAGPYTVGYGADGKAFVAPCLDLGVPLPLDVHDEKSDWPELRALLELDPPKREAIAIPSHAVLVVSSHAALASRGEPPCERRSLARSGAWKIRAI